jgi:hypothetical protein
LFLGMAEIVFVSWAIASNRPRRSSEVQAVTRHVAAPTPENKKLLVREQHVTEREIGTRKLLGYSLVVANLCLIALIARRRAGTQ